MDTQEHAESPRPEETPVAPETAMIFLAGSKTSFRCGCGCNVFEKTAPNRYRCNGCQTRYTGE